MQEVKGLQSGVGGITKTRQRLEVKHYDVCLVEEVPQLSDARISRTVVGTGFQHTDGSIKVIFKPGISVCGSVEFFPSNNA